jgi:hypothetical protein
MGRPKAPKKSWSVRSTATAKVGVLHEDHKADSVKGGRGALDSSIQTSRRTSWSFVTRRSTATSYEGDRQSAVFGNE